MGKIREWFNKIFIGERRCENCMYSCTVNAKGEFYCFYHHGFVYPNKVCCDFRNRKEIQ